MKFLRKKLDNSIISIQCKVNNFLTEERGDTNFISIAIVLAIVLMVAVAFIAMKDLIMGKVQEMVDTFLEKLSI